jgi:hypothetical protein
MKSKINLKLQFASAGLVAALTVVGAATAQTLPKEGRYDYTACWSGVSNLIAFSKTHSAFSYEMTGSIRSNPTGGLFDRNSFRCVGMNSSFDGKISASTVCEGVDPDGDKRLSSFSTQGDKVVRENVTGTGKYEGMVASGTVEPMPPFPTIKPGTFQACNHQTGTYKLK